MGANKGSRFPASRPPEKGPKMENSDTNPEFDKILEDVIQRDKDVTQAIGEALTDPKPPAYAWVPVPPFADSPPNRLWAETLDSAAMIPGIFVASFSPDLCAWEFWVSTEGENGSLEDGTLIGMLPGSGFCEEAAQVICSRFEASQVEKHERDQAPTQVEIEEHQIELDRETLEVIKLHREEALALELKMGEKMSLANSLMDDLHNPDSAPKLERWEEVRSMRAAYFLGREMVLGVAESAHASAKQERDALIERFELETSELISALESAATDMENVRDAIEQTQTDSFDISQTLKRFEAFTTELMGGE